MPQTVVYLLVSRSPATAAAAAAAVVAVPAASCVGGPGAEAMAMAGAVGGPSLMVLSLLVSTCGLCVGVDLFRLQTLIVATSLPR